MNMPLTVSYAITAKGKQELHPFAAGYSAATLVIGSL
jgi:hypothetical protein